MTLAHIDSHLPATPPAGGAVLAITTIEQAVVLADRICKTNFVPAAYRGKADETLACILYGTELGIGPMAALNSIDIVQGSVFLRAQLVQALARSVGGYIDVEGEPTAESATVLAKRPGWSAPKRVTFTWAEAQRQGLTNKDPWKKDPAGMLVNRATTRAGRWFFADVLKGMYVEGDDVDSTPADDDTVASEPVETFAQLAEKRMAELPGAAGVVHGLPTKCSRCGKDPADGLASIGDDRYCHGNESPSCYELAQAPDEPSVVNLFGEAGEPPAGDDYLAWGAPEWANACVGKLGLPEIGRRWKARGIRNYRDVALADPELRTAIYQALVDAS